MVLKRQQKIFFQISCAGHEALLVAAGMALRPGYDWFFPYYRDRAICLALGNTVEEHAAAVGGGGERYGERRASDAVALVEQQAEYRDAFELDGDAVSACDWVRGGGALLCAASGGGDEASRRGLPQFKDVKFHGDEVVYVSIGEGSTSQGEFWESLNTASNGKLPVLYVVEDNGYAISTPVEANTPGGNISRLIANFPNFHFAEVDGTDPIASYEAMVEAVAYCRAGRDRRWCMGMWCGRTRIR